MAEFTWSPDYGASKTSKPRVDTIKFGDGYEQRTAHGLNTNLKTWSLRFSTRDDDEADEIEDFLEDKDGVTAFEWTPPAASESSNFVCEEWNRSHDSPGRSTVTATFRQVAEP